MERPKGPPTTSIRITWSVMYLRRNQFKQCDGNGMRQTLWLRYRHANLSVSERMRSFTQRIAWSVMDLGRKPSSICATVWDRICSYAIIMQTCHARSAWGRLHSSNMLVKKVLFAIRRMGGKRVTWTIVPIGVEKRPPLRALEEIFTNFLPVSHDVTHVVLGGLGE